MIKKYLKWVLLVLLSLIWGSSFILIKKSIHYFSPMQVGALRVFGAGLLLLPIALKNRHQFPKPLLKWVIIAGMCGNFFPMFLFPLAEMKVSSSIAGVINSLMPICVILLGFLFWNIKTSLMQIIGVLISVSGAYLLLYSGNSSEKIHYLEIAYLLLATLFYGMNTMISKMKLNHLPSLMLSSFIFGFILIIPSFLVLVFTDFFSSNYINTSHLEGFGYIALLSVFGTGLAMIIYYEIIRLSSPLFASTVSLLMPIVAVIWGFLDGEILGALQLVGALIILMGLLFLKAQKTHQ